MNATERAAHDVALTDAGDEQAAWPYASLLLFGYFGSGDAGGRQLGRRTTAALALIVLAAIGASGAFGTGIPHAIWALAIPLGVALIGWSYAVYLGTLDELSRMIQLQAMAFAYFATMVLFFTAIAIGLVQPDVRLTGLPVVLVVFAEPLRGLALVYFARQHQ